MLIGVIVNGVPMACEVPPATGLVTFLHEDLALIGTRVGCNNGICGSCTVLMNGEPVRACLLLAVQVDAGSITTIEGLSTRTADGTHRLDPLQAAFVEHGAVQCGFCIPGMLMAARALLDRNPQPGVDDITTALEGNLCRCTGYVKIVEAVVAAARSG